jgi:hypothetical protein
MEREEEKPKAFTVNDRRRFSSEGDLKPEFREGEDRPAAPEPPPSVIIMGEASPSTAQDTPHADQHAHDAHVHDLNDPNHAHEHAQHAHEHPHDDPHDHDDSHEHLADEPHDHHAHSGAGAEITFGTFLVGLSTQALMLLGDIPDPQTGKPERDLVGAQQLIDIIGMLEQKTRGNLDREEAQLIKSMLFELRMKYVESARPGR